MRLQVVVSTHYRPPPLWGHSLIDVTGVMKSEQILGLALAVLVMAGRDILSV